VNPHGPQDALRFRRRRAAAVLAAAILLSALPFLLLKGKRLDADMDALLPDDPEITAELAFLRDSAAGSTVAVSITADSAENASRLPAIAADFAERAAAASPLIKKVVFRPDSAACIDAVANILARYPQLTTPQELSEIDGRLSPDAVAGALSKRRNELLQPGGLFKKGMIASDPLGLRSAAAGKIEHALVAGSFKVVPSNGALRSRDGKSVLVLVEVDATPTDSKKAKEIYAAVNSALRGAVPEHGFETLVVSAHKHAIDNERLLKRDIRVTMLAATIGFLLLFLVFFRSWRAGFVFATPFLGMCCAIGASWLFFPKPSAVILGLGATVIGISLDYGIHVFVAANGKKDPFAATGKVSRPLLFSALTTLGVFWAFFLSSTPGYHQLAFASTVGIAASLTLSLTCLPLLLGPRRGNGSDTTPPTIRLPIRPAAVFKRAKPKKTALVLAGAAVAAAACLAAAATTGFDMDIRKLDGAGKNLIQDERAFRSVWGGSTPAAAVARAESMDKAMETQDAFANFAEKESLPGFQSLSMIWPSLSTRTENTARWDAFWKRREHALRKNIESAGTKLSFSQDAFEPFFQHLYKHDFSDSFTEKRGFQLLAARFIGKKHGKKAMAAAFFDDTPENVEKAAAFAEKHPEIHIVSPKLFGERVSNAVLADAFRAAAAAAILVLILAWICLKRLRTVVAALIPVLFGALAIFPIHAIAGTNLNAMALVAAIVVAGLAIDYGIFAVTAFERNDPEFSSDAFSALTLSMLTTLAGAGALLWAAHPALKTVGLVVCSGVAAAYLAAVIVVPAAATALPRATRARGAGDQ